MHRQLLAVDQTLRILKLDWERDPAGFDIAALQRRSGSSSDVLAQVLVLDARGRVHAGTRRDLVEADLSGRRYFQVHRQSDTDGPYADAPTRSGARGVDAHGAWSLPISRRLNAARGVFAGVVVAGYDLSALTRELAQADLGPRGLVALVGRDGRVRALVNRVAREPGDDISANALYAAVFGGGAPGGRVERGEQRVLDQHTGLGQAVEQAGLAGVGVAGDGHGRNAAALPPRATQN